MQKPWLKRWNRPDPAPFFVFVFVFQGSPQLAHFTSTGEKQFEQLPPIRMLVIQDFNLQFKKAHSQPLTICPRKLLNTPGQYGNAGLIFAALHQFMFLLILFHSLDGVCWSCKTELPRLYDSCDLINLGIHWVCVGDEIAASNASQTALFIGQLHGCLRP